MKKQTFLIVETLLDSLLFYMACNTEPFERILRTATDANTPVLERGLYTVARLCLSTGGMLMIGTLLLGVLMTVFAYKRGVSANTAVKQAVLTKGILSMLFVSLILVAFAYEIEDPGYFVLMYVVVQIPVGWLVYSINIMRELHGRKQ